MEKKGTDHSLHLKRLKRVEGQIRGIYKMIEEQRYCMDILMQIKAVKSSLSSLENKIIEEHLNFCVHKALIGKDINESTGMIQEIKGLLKKASQ